MKENNKFSLSAFFCSLGSKSKLSKFVLLGAPFILVYFLSLKVYANSAVIPVVPEGLTSSGVGTSGVVPGDPSLMYYTLLIALGMKADEVYQVNKADIIDSITEALNEYDSVNDPNLGDDLETYLDWYDNAKSQNGYVNELSIPRELWDRLNKATSNGLDIKINNPSSLPIPTSGESLFNSLDAICNFNFSYSGNPSFWNQAYTNNIPYNIYVNDDGWGDISYYVIFNGTMEQVNGYLGFYGTSYPFWIVNNRYAPGGVAQYTSDYTPLLSSQTLTFIDSSSGTNVNKSIGVARPFISSKANGTYDVLSKSGVINDQTGDLEGDITMSILSYDKIKDIASDYEDSATDIPVFFPDSRLVPIDIENPDAIPDSVGIPGDTPQEIVDSLADTFDPSPAEPIVIEPFNYIDQWDPVIPVAAESPLVGLPFVMNWVAEQMQITMFLSQFSNTWLVLSTLAVASCLVGLVRIWR